MKRNKLLLLVLLIINCSLNTYSQNENKQVRNNFNFNNFTFHSSNCKKNCNKISINIYSDKRIELVRRIFKKSGEVDTTLSGNFKGYLNKRDFNKIINLITKINWDTTALREEPCCDFPTRTFLMSFNDKTVKIRIVNIPDSFKALVKYLMDLGSTISLPKYNKPIDFEAIE